MSKKLLINGKFPGSGENLPDGRYMFPVELAKKIQVDRAKDGGYQRDVNLKRVEAIAESLAGKTRSNYPEITVANVRGTYYCVDGQHRLFGHIKAGKDIPVNLIRMTREESIDLFIRDNGQARALRKRDLIAGSRHPIAQEIRDLATHFKLSQTQVTALVIGVMNKYTLPLDDRSFLTKKQSSVMRIVLTVWTKDPRFVGKIASDFKTDKDRTKFMKSIERSFSSTCTLWVLGKLALDHMEDTTELRWALNVIQNADWAKQNLGSLRKQALDASNQGRKRMLETVKVRILLPEYKRIASSKRKA